MTSETAIHAASEVTTTFEGDAKPSSLGQFVASSQRARQFKR